MCDDGIGLVVLQEIKKRLPNQIETIIGETDYMYCLDRIKSNDILIVIDSSNLGIEPGSLSFYTLDEIVKKQSFSSQHQVSLLDLFKINQFKNKVYVILIEVSEIKYHNGLSKVLSEKFSSICEGVFHMVKQILKENDYA